MRPGLAGRLSRWGLTGLGVGAALGLGWGAFYSLSQAFAPGVGLGGLFWFFFVFPVLSAAGLAAGGAAGLALGTLAGWLLGGRGR